MADATAPLLQALQRTLAEARAEGQALRIVGGNTRAEWWATAADRPLEMTSFRGIVTHEPSELVVTARAGTPLLELENALAERDQCLGFEPPRLSEHSTLGGAISSGWSGPARPYLGSARDHVLGVRLLAADGAVLRFGGEVMKNVAGYDVSRLVTGAWGRFGPLLDISLRVYPRPEATVALRWACDEAEAWRQMVALGKRFTPVSGCRYVAGQLHVRLAGNATAVDAAVRELPAGAREDDVENWTRWRDFADPWFKVAGPLWRVIVPAATAPIKVGGHAAWDWGGALRWYRDVADPEELARLALVAGGYARPWRVAASTRLSDDAVGNLSRRLVQGFVPTGCFNPEAIP